jgi:hypothetical protein
MEKTVLHPSSSMVRLGMELSGKPGRVVTPLKMTGYGEKAVAVPANGLCSFDDTLIVGGVVALIMQVVKLVHPLKAVLPNVAKPAGNVTVTNVQFKNALVPMLVTMG